MPSGPTPNRSAKVRRRRRASILATLAAGLTLAAAPSAGANTVTIGSPLTATFSGSAVCSSPCTVSQSALPGAKLTSPVDGTVVAWRVKGASGPAMEGFKLRVLHPAGFGTFIGAGTSTTGSPQSVGTEAFPTNLPIKAGDSIGLNPTSNTEQIGTASTAGAGFVTWDPPLADNTNPRGPTFGPFPPEIAFNADIQPLPGVSSLSPASGPAAGGTSVTIQGQDFTGTTAVSFGGTPSASFNVDSDAQITAVSPPGQPGAVDVGIENPGASPTVAADQFTYEGCVVPNLKRKKLKKAKKALKGAQCKIGKVKGRKGGKVKKQSPKPGTVLPVGGKVKVKLK